MRGRVGNGEGRGDGSPPSRGQAMREDTEGGVRVCGGRLLARTTVSVTTEPVSRKMGPRMREDTGRGVLVRGGRDGLAPPAFAGAGFRREDNGTGRVCVRGGRDGLAPPAFAGAGFRREDTGGGALGMGGRVCVHEGRDGLARRARTRDGGAFLFAGGGYSRGQREGRDGLGGSWGQRDGAHSGSRGEAFDARTRDGGAFVFGRGGMGWRVRVRGGRGYSRGQREGRDGFLHARGQRDGGAGFGEGGEGDGLADAWGHGTRAGSCSRGAGWVGGFVGTTGWGAFGFAGGGSRREGGGGKRDGFQHARGHGGGDGFLHKRGQGTEAGLCSRGEAIREDNGRGRIRVRGGRDGDGRREGRRDSSTALRCARNDMWGGTR